MTRRWLTYLLLIIGVIVALAPFVVTILASLKSTRELVQGIFSLPVGVPSRIFRDDDAFHIIRVLQREPFQRKPFDDPEVQSEIREKLREQRRDEQTEKYLARLRQQFPVWTVFDDDPELAELRRQFDASRN